MSALKAVRINKSNKQTLEAQYRMSENFLEFSSGLYLIAEFGDTQYKALLTKTGLEANYEIGKPLLNDFFEITRKTFPNA